MGDKYIAPYYNYADFDIAAPGDYTGLTIQNMSPEQRKRYDQLLRAVRSRVKTTGEGHYGEGKTVDYEGPPVDWPPAYGDFDFQKNWEKKWEQSHKNWFQGLLPAGWVDKPPHQQTIEEFLIEASKYTSPLTAPPRAGSEAEREMEESLRNMYSNPFSPLPGVP